MTAVLEFTPQLEVTHAECCKCGHLVLMTSEFQRLRKRDHAFWHCTACGTSQHWPAGTSDIENLRKELDAEKRRSEWARANAKAEREARERTERRLSATRGAANRLRNRVKNGVCPCCTRTFVNLQRHMPTQHPDFGGEPQDTRP